mgnify:CR=1 FL=1
MLLSKYPANLKTKKETPEYLMFLYYLIELYK